MIGRPIDGAATLAVGLAIGFLITVGAESDPDAPPAKVPRSSTAASQPTVSPADGILTNIDDTSCDDITFGSKHEAIVTREPVPDVYRGMIGPLAERTPTPTSYDRYVAFARDVRDEPWAAAMEAGIANWSARRNPSADSTIEYFECRSRFCVIAGHSSRGSSRSLSTMRDEGWWLAEGDGMLAVSSGRDSSLDFILFVERYADTNL